MNHIYLEGDARDFLLWREASGGTIEIYDVAVGSERRVGKGRQLVAELFRLLGPARPVYAITRADNAIGLQWYAALGFRVVAVLMGFYSGENQVDAVMVGRNSAHPV